MAGWTCSGCGREIRNVETPKEHAMDCPNIVALHHLYLQERRTLAPIKLPPAKVRKVA